MSTTFQGIRIVGGVVPPALLGRIQSSEVSDSQSLTPSSYRLAGNETPRDAASRAWTYLRGAWAAWRAEDEIRTPGTAGTGPARERWLLPLLRALDYGQVPLMPTSSNDDGDYPISHLWGHVPVHLLGPGVDLDRRNAGIRGAARAPQSMVQEFLNRRDEYLWAIVSNGRQLRLLRDSTALAGSAYLEFDLETIFDGELYAEFLLMWQLIHVSRLEKRGGPEAPPADCWIESWRGEAVSAGTRALNLLRGGVETSLSALGSGILRHPDNRWLVDALRSGEITDRQFHTALLRTVYRLLFCFVAEDRNSLLDPEASPAAAARYRQYFSTTRLRRLSRKRSGGPHPDLWQAMRLVLRGLGSEGIEHIAIPALGGLFDPSGREPKIATQPFPDLILGVEIANTEFLTAIRALGWVSVKGQRIQPVDYRHLGSEELGSVYESLLELIPRLDLADHTFTLEQVSGNERKTTGSYYTPPALVSALLDTALDPLLDDAVKNADSAEDAEVRLRKITVCDPACGSGGFLVAAARRISRRLAAVRSGEDEPTPIEVQHALRDVVGECIYGVDINEMAADLAKVSLWLEALEPGMPLGFLDARIKVGNALLGTTPTLLAAGMPDDAFKALEGDDKLFATAVKKRNKSESGAFSGQGSLFLSSNESQVTAIGRERRALAGALDDVDSERARLQTFLKLESSAAFVAQRQRADAWVAAFVWPLHEDAPQPPTNLVLRGMAEGSAPAATLTEVDRLAKEYRFFHWDLEFPEIFHDGEPIEDGPEGWTGGFSCMLGNPPWERVKLQEQEFFAARDPEIAKAPNAAARRKKIAALATSESEGDRRLHAEFLAARRRAEGESAVLRTSGRYPLNGRGDVNTYAVFAELFRTITSPRGRSGIIVPTGIATDATTQYFIKDLIEKRSLAALYDFENAAPIFEGVHRSFKFCLLTTAGRAKREDAATFAFFLHDPQSIATSEFALTPEEITLLNPNTGTIPIFRTRRDAEITLGIYRRVPVLINETDPVNGNPWGVSFMRMFDMTNDSDLFHSRDELEAEGWVFEGNTFTYSTDGACKRMLPLYEAKMLAPYDHRDADVVKSATAAKRQNQPRYLTNDDHIDPRRLAIPGSWIAEDELPQLGTTWLTGFSNVTSPTNERTMLSAALPRSGVGNSYVVFASENRRYLLSTFNSMILDYVARQKVAGLNLNFHYVNQFPVPSQPMISEVTPYTEGESFSNWITPRILELTYTAWDMQSFAEDLGDFDAPFVWSIERRFLLRTELDAAFFHLYSTNRDDVNHILDTFTGVRRKDEEVHGEYRTKRVILEIFDAMQSAINTGEPYSSVLKPAPGEGPRHPMTIASEPSQA
ncbi:Eco57I restriction-modification methylase domain-containing protein [Rhodococcus erythropolis]|uniref:Eco57I restriction-modification methylase domain-containing protein n=1 Tax=Rhodococcus erythropolis TaxID=1833 RepID=UPI0024B85504|nr:DNA methyltransferase [Rhodococcus erythropolis]MDJ0012670.1 N-6 DNA methylase [Rhodococcus erythropolis]